MKKAIFTNNFGLSRIVDANQQLKSMDKTKNVGRIEDKERENYNESKDLIS